ncbi:MAG: hypothetical protein H7831_08300 [Magnetococcus sp. WYHC-3]
MALFIGRHHSSRYRGSGGRNAGTDEGFNRLVSLVERPGREEEVPLLSHEMLRAIREGPCPLEPGAGEGTSPGKIRGLLPH